MTAALVDTEWLSGHLADPGLRVIEVNRNGVDAYQSGHIPGAIGWNWKDMLWDPLQRQFPASDLFARRLGAEGIADTTTIVLYGDPVQFGTYAWWVLRYMGHNDVRLLDGGRTKWVAEGRALTGTVEAPDPVEYRPNPRRDGMRAGREDVLGCLGAPDVTILDHRSIEEYTGARVAPTGMADVGAERYGRIPGAQHIAYHALLNEDDTFKSPAELRDVIATVVPAKDRSIVSYCRLSHRATLACFAMTEILGYRNVRVYDGSWTEWGSMVGMPVER